MWYTPRDRSVRIRNPQENPMLGTSIAVLKPLAAVGAIALVGMGGYNFATSGCPLGSCSSKNANTALTSNTDSKALDSSCGSCPSMTQPETTALVSHSEGAAADSVCSDAMKAACESMGECPEALMAHCETAGECPMGGQAELVADKQTECEKACDDAGEQTAEAEAAEDTSEG